MKTNVLIMLLLIMVSEHTLAQNPVIPDIGMSDPHMRVFNDTLYLFCGHDSHPDDKTWVMKDWRIFSSTNLLDWHLQTTISPKENFMDDNSSDCWAGDAATRNGKYYFYFSDRKRGIGVMQAEEPAGPYKDALGKPLVAPMHDPTILIDDDTNQTPYMVYGDKKGSFQVVKLKNDMISLVEEPKPLVIHGPEWDKAPGWMDKNYIFKHNEKYYLSWGRDYAVAENIYGPYQCMGAVGEGHQLNEYAHGSFFHWKGQFYHIWCYYLRPGYKYRESIISYCHMDKQGKIVTDTRFLDLYFANGVGHYQANWDKIEAEWYYEKSSGANKEDLGERNFGVNLSKGEWIRFTRVSFENSPKSVAIMSAGISGKGKLEIRLGSKKGKKVAQIPISAKKANQLLTSNLKQISGSQDIYLLVKGNQELMLVWDWMKFE